jgi:hypothetical protein
MPLHQWLAISLARDCPVAVPAMVRGPLWDRRRRGADPRAVRVAVGRGDHEDSRSYTLARLDARRAPRHGLLFSLCSESAQLIHRRAA